MLKIDGPLSQNITIVYDSLDLATFDSAKLKTLAENPIRPVMVETPEMITMVLPPYPIVIQVGDQRFRFTAPRGTAQPAFSVLSNLVHKCVKSIVPKQAKMTAFGFNYDLHINTETSAIDLLNQEFVSNLEDLNHKLDGTLLYSLPRLVFQRNNVQYDLIFELIGDQQILAHTNAHFETRNKPFLSNKELLNRFVSEYEFARQTVFRLFDRSNL
ncbi:MAG: hypothetical protein U0175_08040 [Caldilineaceae bacterium]